MKAIKMIDKWIPEIFYEEDGEGLTRGLPFVKVPEDKLMPSALFMCEIRDIKEEVEQEVDLTVHMYANMSVLKERLTIETYNKIRSVGLGLEDIEESKEKAKQTTTNSNNNLT
jgi:hypothetical protein